MTETLQALAKNHFNLDVSEATAQAFETYAEQLIHWNERINLTSIIDPDEIRIKHFLDSLSILTLPNLPEAATLVDVGTGAGLPGLALKMMRPAWDVTLMDSTGKKVDFLNNLIDQLGLSTIRAVKMRAEDAGQDPRHREQYDLVTARAVARMPILAEYLLPLCKKGGYCIAMKGETAESETQDAAPAFEILGGKLESTTAITLPDVEQTHYLVRIQKINPTPHPYPRRAGIPSKKPLYAILEGKD